MNRLRWTLGSLASRLGWPGMAGAALLAFALAFQLTAVSTFNTELDARRAEATRLSARYQIALKEPAAVKPGATQQLATFYEFFPPAKTVPDWLSRLNQVAAKHGVTLERGEYKLVQEQGWKLQRYQMILPVKGSYAQIRAFIADALVAVPAAAVNEIALKRDGVAATTLEAQIRLTLFLGANAS